MKTVGQLVNYVDALVPNSLATTDKYVFLSDIIKDVRQYNTFQSISDTNTSTNVSIYNLPTGVIWSDIEKVLISQTTYCSTNTSSNLVNSTSFWDKVALKGIDDPEYAYQYSLNHSSQMTIYGLSTQDRYHIRVIHVPTLSFGVGTTTDSTTILEMDDCLTDYIQHKLAGKVCRSGAFPRIDLSNNYEMEAIERLGDLKLNKRKAELNRTDRKMSYKGWW